MGRLTTYRNSKIYLEGTGDDSCCVICYVSDCEDCPIQEAFDKLAHYEDLEEAGRLIELPCAVGDTVYIPNERFPAEVEEIRITPRGVFAEYVQYDRSYEITEVWDGGSFWIDDVGKRVFLTKEEAEAKLKELSK